MGDTLFSGEVFTIAFCCYCEDVRFVVCSVVGGRDVLFLSQNDVPNSQEVQSRKELAEW